MMPWRMRCGVARSVAGTPSRTSSAMSAAGGRDGRGRRDRGAVPAARDASSTPGGSQSPWSSDPERRTSSTRPSRSSTAMARRSLTDGFRFTTGG